MLVCVRLYGDFRITDVGGGIAAHGDGQVVALGMQCYPTVRAGRRPFRRACYRDGGRSAFRGERDTTSGENDHICDLFLCLIVATTRCEGDQTDQ